MKQEVTFKGNPLTLVGRALVKDKEAPNFNVVSQDLKEVRLSDFEGKIKVITSFPSLDTPVCDFQVKEFNKRAGGASSEVVILGISKDLPFAQKRFCDVNSIKNVIVLSDYKSSSFGINYGLLIKELNLLARAVVVVDKNDVLRYIKIVDELTDYPDYEEALDNLNEIVNSPPLSIGDGLSSQCKPCEGGVLPLPKETIARLVIQHQGWELIDDKKLKKEFRFKDFVEAKYFLDLVSVIAEEQKHHPTMILVYDKLRVILTTHSAGGLTENDFIMAKIVDEIVG